MPALLLTAPMAVHLHKTTVRKPIALFTNHPGWLEPETFERAAGRSVARVALHTSGGILAFDRSEEVRKAMNDALIGVIVLQEVGSGLSEATTALVNTAINTAVADGKPLALAVRAQSLKRWAEDADIRSRIRIVGCDYSLDALGLHHLGEHAEVVHPRQWEMGFAITRVLNMAT